VNDIHNFGPKPEGATTIWQLHVEWERLQAQNQACSARSAFHSTGENAVPLCEPSQNGWLFERPHAHHQ